MGWASWNSFGNAYDSTTIQQQAQAMVSSGMKAAGYQYLLLDEGWWLGVRDNAGNLVVDKQQWPAIQPGERAGDMANIVRYIHSLGLKAGIYTDAGEFGCSYLGPDTGGPRPHTGSYGHYEQDFLQFARWGFDYVKVDWCGGDKPNLDPMLQYTEIARAMTDAERQTGHHLFFSLCEWGRQRPWDWAPGVGGVIEDMWRVGGDITDPIVDDSLPVHVQRKVGAANILKNFDEGIHPEAQHTGFYNDLDMMVIGMRGMSEELDHMHMSLWAVAASPLMVGADLTRLTPSQKTTLNNAEVLAVNQDPWGLQGMKAGETKQGLEVWSKVLSKPGQRAVVLLNRATSSAPISFSLDQLGLRADSSAHVRDLWVHKDVGEANPSFSQTVAAGEAVLFLVTGREPESKTYNPEPKHKASDVACPRCSVETNHREYLVFARIQAKREVGVVMISYRKPSGAPSLVYMQVNGHAPTRVSLFAADQLGSAAVQAVFDTSRENTIKFWSVDGSENPVISIAVSAE
jgi:hypothetical protein